MSEGTAGDPGRSDPVFSPARLPDRPLSERVRVNMGADFDSDEWADEIAALEAEVDAREKDCASLDFNLRQEIAALEAKNKRLNFLWDENAKVAKISAALEAENKRLQAALERIHAAPGLAGEITSAVLNREGGDDG